ncbi:MAG: phage major capsid protein [Lachnospiraceae bacterium]
MKDKLLKMIAAKQQARAAAMKEMAETDDKEVRASQLELIQSIDEEIGKLKEMVDELKDGADPGDGGTDPEPGDPASRSKDLKPALDGDTDPDLIKRAEMLPVGDTRVVGRSEKIDDQNKVLEQRGADLKAGKSITLRATPITTENGVLIEKKYSRELSPTFNEVSTLIDSVHSVPLQGGESYSKSFVVSGGEGDYTEEGAAAADIDPKTDFVEIAKAKITAYAEVTEEIKKLPNIDYASFVEDEVRKSIRKKATRQIIAGAGTTNTLTGIYNAPANVIPTDSDFEVSAIDEDTLNNIVFAYGGDEDVEDEAVLVLSKADLRAFSNVKNGDLKRVYKIEKRGNTGTISYADGGVGVDYIINSACNSLSAEATAAGKYTMVYGRPGAYELPIFSDLEIKEDSSYKFKEGNIAFRGVVFLGGNVGAYKGWMRIKKKAAAAG